MAKIDSVFDFSDKALVELKSWLEPWFLTCPGGGGAVSWEDVGVDCSGGGGETFSTGVVTLGATGNLLAYWRLGETSGPFADSNPYLAACDLTQISTGTALTANVAGALFGAQDDGAVQFNNSTGGSEDHLESGCGTRFDLNSTNFSVAAWVEPLTTASTFTGQVVGAYGPGTSTATGWQMYVSYPTMDVSFVRQQDGGSTATVTGAMSGAGVWVFVVATYSTTGGLNLYVNGSLVDSDATTFNTGAPHLGVWIGAKNPTGAYFYGGVDEVSVWGSTLSATDISSLYLLGI